MRETGETINIFFAFHVSRQAGYRMCIHIGRVMELLFEFSQCDDDELREFCLQAFEAFVYHCPTDIRTHIPMVSQSVLIIRDGSSFLFRLCTVHRS